MKWFQFKGLKRKKKEDDFEEKYGDLLENTLPKKKKKERGVFLEQEPLFANNEEQRKQFVENHCEKIAEATKKIEDTKKEYQMVNEYLSDIQMIESLPEGNRDRVVQQAKRVVVLEKDRVDFGKSMSKMSSAQYNRIKDCGDDIKRIMKDLSDDEQYCQRVRSDMNNLEGEKNALRYERRAMKDQLYMVRGISKIAVSAFTAIILMLFLVQVNSEKSIQAYLYVAIGIAAVTAMTLFLKYHSAVRNLKNIEYRINHVIGLLNKVKLRYVNVESRIEYVYAQFGIHTSYELNKIWGEYLQCVREQEVYHQASNKLYEAEEELEEEMKKYSLHDPEIWVNQAYALIDEKEFQRIKEELCSRRKKLMSAIEYNRDVIEKSQEAIRNLAMNNKEYAKEILDLVDRFEAD